jgi:hypothetical protein
LVLVDVVWRDLVNTSVSGDTLTKTGGCDGCLDAGAESDQFTPAGNGYLEFTVMDITHVRYIGFNANGTTTKPTDMLSVLKLVNGSAEVKEDSQYRTDVPVKIGDVIRIAVNSGVLTYAKNGTVFYTSAVRLNDPLQVDTALISKGGSFKDVKITVAASGGSSAAGALTGTQNVAWAGLVNTTADGASLVKTGGCDGCQDAGAVSQQQLTSGDGSLEFTVGETGPVLFIGLNDDSTGTGAAEIPFAIKLEGGYAEVRENGLYRANIAAGSGDVLRIAVQAGAVSYARNGVMFYTSDTGASYPLRVDTSFVSSGSTVNNVRITGFTGDSGK